MAGLMGTNSFTQELAANRAANGGGSGLLQSVTPFFGPQDTPSRESYSRPGEQAAGRYTNPQSQIQRDIPQPNYQAPRKPINIANLGAISGAAKENTISNRNDAGTGVVSRGGPAVPQFQAPQGPAFDPTDPNNAALAGYMMG